MGAWGAGIFDNDDAEDLRNLFQDHIAEGMSVESASEACLTQLLPDDQPTSQRADLYFSLAMMQWEHGGVDATVRINVAELLADNSGLELWDDPKDRRKRQQALKRFDAKLKRTPPKPRKKPSRQKRKFEIGRCYEYQSSTGVVHRIVCVDARRHGPYFAHVSRNDLAQLDRISLEDISIWGTEPYHYYAVFGFDFDDKASASKLKATELIVTFPEGLEHNLGVGIDALEEFFEALWMQSQMTLPVISRRT